MRFFRFFVSFALIFRQICLILRKFSLTMNSINEIQDEIIAEFSDFDDWMDRYAYIIELGNALPAIEEKYKTAQNLIEGCQSRVWLNATLSPDGTILFEADSDAIIVKGLISLLVRSSYESSAGISRRKSLMPTSISSTKSNSTSTCRQHAATDCAPW